MCSFTGLGRHRPEGESVLLRALSKSADIGMEMGNRVEE